MGWKGIFMDDDVLPKVTRISSGRSNVNDICFVEGKAEKKGSEIW